MRNTAKVDANTFFPDSANPAAAVTMDCSDIPMLKNLSGNSFPNIPVLVEEERSASRTTTLGSLLPRLTSSFP
jgi:hypothetical protein